MLSVFGSTYICEQTFSLMNYRKSKYALRLTDGHMNTVLRISTKIKPTINNLVDAIQSQKSYNVYCNYKLVFSQNKVYSICGL